MYQVCYCPRAIYQRNTVTMSYRESVARLAAEAAAVRVVRAAEGCLGDGGFSRPVVAVHRVPDHKALSFNVAAYQNGAPK